jgi:hypothetical protein
MAELQGLVPFCLETAKPFTFVTTSSGGRHAIETLADQVALKRRLTPGVSPVVKLSWAAWGRQFPKSRPDFQVIEWIALGGQAEPRPHVIANPLGGEPPPHLDAPPHDHVPAHDEMADEIPF